jgi:hypothetical protein
MSFFRTKRNNNNVGPVSTSPDEYPIPPHKTQDNPYGRNGTVGGPSSKKLMGKPMSPGRRRRLWQSYGLDWLLTIVVWVSLLDWSDLAEHYCLITSRADRYIIRCISRSIWTLSNRPSSTR